MEPDASMICRMVVSMLAMAAWPLPATSAVSSATSLTSFMVLTNSLDVAEICLEVAPICAVVAAISLAVLCCLSRGGGNLRGRCIDLDAGALHLADEHRKIIRQTIQAIAQNAEFIAPLNGELSRLVKSPWRIRSSASTN